jgi:hypothetical protein
MKNVSIKQALQQVADYPVMVDDDLLGKPVYELVARSLFDIANRPDANVRGSMARANKARKLILDRMVGKRRPGSHPATREVQQLDFIDLTGGVIDEPAEGVQPPDGGGPGPGPGGSESGGDPRARGHDGDQSPGADRVHREAGAAEVEAGG